MERHNKYLTGVQFFYHLFTIYVFCCLCIIGPLGLIYKFIEATIHRSLDQQLHCVFIMLFLWVMLKCFKIVYLPVSCNERTNKKADVSKK